MLRPRLIPCLLLKGGGLFKTVQFAEPKYVGDPINAVRIFNEKEADELMVLDIDCTANSCPPDVELIARLAVECRMPLCYGGGVKTVEQAKNIVGLGVEKVAVSSAAIEEPQFIRKLSDEIGSQSVVVVIDAKKRLAGAGYDAFIKNGRVNTNRQVVEVAVEAEAAGAGEVVLNSIDNDGRMTGYDLALAKEIRREISIPLTVLGGAGSLSHLKALFDACGVVGAAAGSLFVFKGPFRAVLINYPNPLQKEELIRSIYALASNKSEAEI